MFLHEEFVLLGERVDAVVGGVEVDLVPSGELLTHPAVGVATLLFGGAFSVEFSAACACLLVEIVLEVEFFLQSSYLRGHVSDEDVL